MRSFFFNVSGSVELASVVCAFAQPDDIPFIVKLNAGNRKSGEGRVCLNLQLHAFGRKPGAAPTYTRSGRWFDVALVCFVALFVPKRAGLSRLLVHKGARHSRATA